MWQWKTHKTTARKLLGGDFSLPFPLAGRREMGRRNKKEAASDPPPRCSSCMWVKQSRLTCATPPRWRAGSQSSRTSCVKTPSNPSSASNDRRKRSTRIRSLSSLPSPIPSSLDAPGTNQIDKHRMSRAFLESDFAFFHFNSFTISSPISDFPFLQREMANAVGFCFRIEN